MSALAEALVKFQKELPTASKDKTANTGAYSYRYLDLHTLTQTVLPVLTKCGLSFITYGRSTENGYELVGRLTHTSGEFLEGALPIYGRQPQEIGSAVTYARRYLLSSMTGVVADEDDDGKAAVKATRTTSQDWDLIADNAETIQDVEELKAFWNTHQVGKAPAVIRDRIKAHGDTLKGQGE